MNPVPVFSSSRGLLAVTAYYPNSSTNAAVDGFNENTSTIPRRTVTKRGHYHDDDEEERFDDDCGCYITRKKPSPTKKPKNEYATIPYSTTTEVGLVTMTPRPTRTPNRPQDEEAQSLEVDPGAFAALFLGISGACLQRRSGVLVCTSNSL